MSAIGVKLRHNILSQNELSVFPKSYACKTLYRAFCVNVVLKRVRKSCSVPAVDVQNSIAFVGDNKKKIAIMLSYR